MKWKDLSLKERKQIYDTVRADNPNATYFDIKAQFDSIPAYEEGKESKPKLPQQLGLTPGTPEYYERERRISGRAESVQPEAYITPAGYIKDAINFVDNIKSGDYLGAAIDVVLNAVPFGAGKLFNKVKSKVSKVNGVSNELNSYAEPFTPTKTTKGKKTKVDTKLDEDLSTAVVRSRNTKEYHKELSQSVEDAVFPDNKTMNIINFVDKNYGTNYKSSYRDIAMRDMTNRGKYVKFESTMQPGHFGKLHKNDLTDADTYSIDDFMISLNPNYYVPGTANHELSHLSDALNNPYLTEVNRSVKEGVPVVSYNNKYLDYLSDYDNMYSVDELVKTGRSNLVSSRHYLSNPTEVKAHMIGLKRALINDGKLKKWSDSVTEDLLNTYFNPRNNSNRVNNTNRDMYNLYRSKQGFVNRMNMLVPMEYAVPIGITGAVGYELNKE